ncbi:hypothetical protein OHA98_20470 [Streptomyces sp. NBC_00654]|uniref:hypothetical protein n=1 Tax=Streptomyces sp. NBC_00654 TaxID=2975799 RepID=UPI00225AE6F1|nr:hypothetical protein [Streptomyces sp. NBC_00654]MCX4967123.1 hypothetical protein [Streptomyces sp. NBC_00654]
MDDMTAEVELHGGPLDGWVVPVEIRQDILTAAAAVRDAPEPDHVAHLLERLGRLNLPDTPDCAR